ncbi:hypothetical protein V2G26_006210 [Clonostachys chloroleuca]
MSSSHLLAQNRSVSTKDITIRKPRTARTQKETKRERGFPKERKDRFETTKAKATKQNATGQVVSHVQLEHLHIRLWLHVDGSAIAMPAQARRRRAGPVLLDAARQRQVEIPPAEDVRRLQLPADARRVRADEEAGQMERDWGESA